MERNYQNPNLIRYFEKYVSQMEVDTNFKPLLVDILLRRAFEFSLTPQEITQDMSSLLNSLKKFEIAKMPKKHEGALGLYIPKERKILINEDFARQALKDGKRGINNLYVTLTHEVYHALARDENGKDRLGSKNRFNGKYNHALLETIVETAADRTVMSRTEKDRFKFRKETNGYPEMTFVVPALAATYGVSEREFLKHAILGREKLVNFLSSYTKESENKVAMFLDGVELNLSKMHEALYSRKSISDKNAKELISESIFAISYMCNSKLEEHYANQSVTDGFSVYNFVENAKYNHVKLHRIIDIEMENLNREYGINVVPQITEMKEESEYDELKTIIDMDKVVCRRQNFGSEEEFLRVFEYAKRGLLDSLNSNYMQEKGIVHTRRAKSFSPIDDRVIRKFDDEDFPLNIPWNNFGVEQYISKNIPGLIPRRNILEIAKDKLQDAIYRKSYSLPEEVNNRNPNMPDYFKLSDKELVDFNKSTKQVLKNHNVAKQPVKQDQKNKED